MIAGNPVVEGYPDNNPPAIVDNKLILGSIGKSVCGNGATRGGSYKKSRKSRKLKNRKSPNKKSNKRHSKNNKNRSISKSNSRSNSNSKSQKGGDFVAIGSKPAYMADAFDGSKGVFNYPDDMKSRVFGETQPNYSVNAI